MASLRVSFFFENDSRAFSACFNMPRSTSIQRLRKKTMFDCCAKRKRISRALVFSPATRTTIAALMVWRPGGSAVRRFGVPAVGSPSIVHSAVTSAVKSKPSTRKAALSSAALPLSMKACRSSPSSVAESVAPAASGDSFASGWKIATACPSARYCAAVRGVSHEMTTALPDGAAEKRKAARAAASSATSLPHSSRERANAAHSPSSPRTSPLLLRNAASHASCREEWRWFSASAQSGEATAARIYASVKRFAPPSAMRHLACQPSRSLRRHGTTAPSAIAASAASLSGVRFI